MPGRGSWSTETLGAAERYRHPFEVVRGRGRVDAGPVDAPGLRVDGEGVVLSAVRRDGDVVEVRVVNETSEPRRARLRMSGTSSASESDLLGRPGATLDLDADGVALDLGPWEIRTVRLDTGRSPAWPAMSRLRGGRDL
jgi:alpha-mannosidase